jgi:hypothetical protein
MGKIKPIDFETCTIFNEENVFWGSECYQGKMIRFMSSTTTRWGNKRYKFKFSDHIVRTIRHYSMPVSVPYGETSKRILKYFDDHGKWPWEGRGTKWKQWFAQNAEGQCKGKCRSLRECQPLIGRVSVVNIRL